MAKGKTKAPSTAHRDRIRPAFPGLIDYTEQVVFGDLWERPGLSKRDRSLITVTALVATNRPAQLRNHLRRAIQNGVTREEFAEVVTHMAFYAGWPNAMTAAQTAVEVYAEDDA